MSGWHHAPAHHFPEAGAYIVTGSTLGKVCLFRDAERLEYLQSQLFSLAQRYGCSLQAWAIFPNHYHFVTHTPPDPAALGQLIKHLHSVTARELNRIDGVGGRRVWFQFWDTHLTTQRGYFARLHYVHQNPVKHGIVPEAVHYPWCSARWFEQESGTSFYRTIRSFGISQVRVEDDFEVAWDPE